MEKNTANYFAKSEPAILDQDYTRNDLIDALQQLRFENDLCLRSITIDSSVRDFLVAALRRR
jgi:hypothetical protein